MLKEEAIAKVEAVGGLARRTAHPAYHLLEHQGTQDRVGKSPLVLARLAGLANFK